MLTFRSPAKINLFLRILNKREDGYHNLASLFQALDLCDTLEFSLSGQDELICSNPCIPTDRKNIVWNAVDVFREKTGKRNPLRIHLLKHIPVEAGLGGGSSNAATTLWALNQLFQTNLSIEQLREMGEAIGSDVPFFFSQGTSFVTGRGETLTAMPPLPYKDVWLVKPQIGLATREVYASMKLALLPKRDPQFFLQQSYFSPDHLFNDMESAAFKLMPSLQALKNELLQCGFDKVLMSGSGTSFFCFGAGRPPAHLPFACKTNFIQRQQDSWW